MRRAVASFRTLATEPFLLRHAARSTSDGVASCHIRTPLRRSSFDAVARLSHTPALSLPATARICNGLGVASWQQRACFSDDAGAKVREFEEVLPGTVSERISEHAQNARLFSVVQLGGKQYKITTDDVITIDKIDADVGERIVLEKVLMVGSSSFTCIGTPLLESSAVRVEATVVEKSRLPKLIVFKKKRRKGYARRQGHRTDASFLRINSITIDPETLQANLENEADASQ